jgi:hypothetical protein
VSGEEAKGRGQKRGTQKVERLVTVQERPCRRENKEVEEEEEEEEVVVQEKPRTRLLQVLLP